MNLEEQALAAAAASKARDDRAAHHFALERMKAYDAAEAAWCEDRDKYAGPRGRALYDQWLDGIRAGFLQQAREEYAASHPLITLEKHIANYLSGQNRPTTDHERACIAARAKDLAAYCARLRKAPPSAEAQERARLSEKHDMRAGFEPNSHV